MEHRLGRIDIVAWQDNHIHDVRRPNGISALLGLIALGSLALLLLRFAVGIPLPLGLLQIAFGVLVAAGALLVMRLLVGLILRLQRS